MSAPFLVRFVARIVAVLEAEGELLLVAGQREVVIRDVAAELGGLGEGHQAIGALARALIGHPGVEELFLDDVALKDRVGALGPGWIRG